MLLMSKLVIHWHTVFNLIACDGCEGYRPVVWTFLRPTVRFVYWCDIHVLFSMVLEFAVTQGRVEQKGEYWYWFRWFFFNSGPDICYLGLRPCMSSNSTSNCWMSGHGLDPSFGRSEVFYLLVDTEENCSLRSRTLLMLSL